MCLGKRKGGYTSSVCVNEPLSYLKNQYSWNDPNLEFFYLVIQVRSCKQHFWTGADSCDLGQRADHYTKAILATQRCWKVPNYDTDLPHPRWFVPYEGKKITEIICFFLVQLDHSIRNVQTIPLIFKCKNKTIIFLMPKRDHYVQTRLSECQKYCKQCLRTIVRDRWNFQMNIQCFIVFFFFYFFLILFL